MSSDSVQHFVVSGRVQGVGFRYSTMEVANQLNISGWVRNRPDGRVEVVAKGKSANLELFAQWLEVGPSFARVESVESSPITLTEDVKEFTIRR